MHASYGTDSTQIQRHGRLTIDPFGKSEKFEMHCHQQQISANFGGGVGGSYGYLAHCLANPTTQSSC